MVISLENVNKTFGKKRVTDDVSVVFPSGTLSAVVGAPGSGKTTLLRLIAGDLKPDSGRVLAKTRDFRAIACENSAFFPGLKIADYCTLWTLLYPGFDVKRCRSLLSEAKITESNRIRAFSESMKTWFNISLVIASNADIMIFDEPLPHLDPEMKVFLLDLLDEAAKKGRSVIVSSEEISELEERTGFVAALNNGSLVLSGESERLLASHRLLPGASTISPDYKVIGPVLDERLAETTDDIGRNATLKEIVSGYINGSSS